MRRERGKGDFNVDGVIDCQEQWSIQEVRL